jgi:hypothetical protein
VATFVVQVDAVADAAAVMLFDCCYPTVTQLSPNCSPTFPNVPQRSPTFAIKNGDHCGVLILLYVLLFTVGKYNSLPGQEACSNCTIGRYNPATSSDALVDCLLCVAGTFSNVRPSILM